MDICNRPPNSADRPQRVCPYPLYSISSVDPSSADCISTSVSDSSRMLFSGFMPLERPIATMLGAWRAAMLGAWRMADIMLGPSVLLPAPGWARADASLRFCSWLPLRVVTFGERGGVAFPFLADGSSAPGWACSATGCLPWALPPVAGGGFAASGSAGAWYGLPTMRPTVTFPAVSSLSFTTCCCQGFACGVGGVWVAGFYLAMFYVWGVFYALG